MTTIYLVRHAKTLNRYAWEEPDRLRPLSKAGFRQADALPEHLGDVSFERLLTSPYIRCVQTFEPLASAGSTALEHVDWLGEGASARRALELLARLADGGVVAACTHGDVILDSLGLLGSARVPLNGPLEYKKGSTWILEAEDGAVVRGRYLAPPLQGKEP
jgi:8-oxo-(d)GTP phosphatase